MRVFGGVQRLSSSSSGMVDLYGWIKVNISTELWEAVWAFKSVQFVAGPEEDDAILHNQWPNHKSSAGDGSGWDKMGWDGTEYVAAGL